MPQIIENGHLYKVYPPLYHIADPNHPYAGSKAERVEMYMKKVVKEYKIRLNLKNSDYFTKDQLWKFLYDTVDYDEHIRELHNFYKVDRGLLEVIIAALVIYGGATNIKNISSNVNGDISISSVLDESKLKDTKFIRDFMRFVQKKYPETTFDEKKCRVNGVVNGSSVIQVPINQKLLDRGAYIVNAINNYGYEIYVKEKGVEEQKLTIMEFLDRTSKLIPKILSRFKGLGEADADQLWETTLNPEKRTLVRLTFDDIEKDIEIFNKLKSDKPFYQKQRKAMFEGYKLRRDDMDN